MGWMPENTRVMARQTSRRRARIHAWCNSAPVAWPAMPYEVQTPVFEGPFDLLLHLILSEQVDLYEVSLSHDRRRLPRRARAHRSDARPRRRHRVPAHRGHARRAEGPAPAARPRRHRPRRGAGAVGGARPAARPPARVQDVQGRRRACSAGWPTTPAARSRAPPGPTSASSSSRPTCSRASRPSSCEPPSCGRVDAEAGARGRPRPRRPGPRQRRRRGRRAGRRAAPRRARSTFRRLTERRSSSGSR